MSTKLGTLENVELREVWNHEAYDFTTWLAKEDNLSFLGIEIGIEIKLIETEANSGNFSVDILAEDEMAGRKIIIENQLEVTNHDHLGKLITYASGHDAEVMVWIAKDCREEHRQAVDWLNEHTDEKINFFLIKIELWKIGDSDPAPKFDIVSKPNNWAKAIKKVSRSGEPSKLALQQIDFFNRFVEYCNGKKTILKLSKPGTTATAYYQVGIGTSKARIAIKMNTHHNLMKVDLYVTNKDTYYKLEESREEIDRKFDFDLIWDEYPESKGSLIGTSFDFNIDTENKYEEYFEEIKTVSEKMQKVFGRYLKEFKK
ncbi:DUF4268 domain-containing protein [Patescibacteria group bacterium]